MVRHDHVHGVLGAALGHMATGAIRGREARMAGGLDRRMTPDALRPVPRHGSRATRNIVRVVASIAGQPPAARPEACRLPEAVCLVDDLKPIPAGSRVEVHDVVAERLSGAEGEDRAVEAPDHLRQLDAGGLQVTLHADVHLQRGREPRRIDDRRTKLFGSSRRATPFRRGARHRHDTARNRSHWPSLRHEGSRCGRRGSYHRPAA